MGTTRMTATNTFSPKGGMLLDFDPLVSKDGGGTWSNALNATMLTFNGNETMMQQDMGNGRVETAYLPEGYVPLGTCEFGDIIYIVSYNPLENKCQLGCFPSPERNITSDEISDMEQSLKGEDFQNIDSETPTGKIKATSVKKILYGNDNMNPGDKFIIYEESSVENDDTSGGALAANKVTLSDYANSSHQHDSWPKLLKLKVVSIEDSGKIIDLDASVKWYSNDYYINFMHADTNGTADLDSYRNLVSSAYSVFTSKVSGKLAILAELESIDGFSCTYDVYTERGTLDSKGDFIEASTTTTTPADYTKYKVYFYTSWETSHNDVNPIGFCFTNSEWPDTEEGGKIFPVIYNEETGKYTYGEGIDQLTPATTAVITTTGGYEGYDYKQLYKYNLTYVLGSDPIDRTYEEYISQYSYNASCNIDDTVDWRKVGDDYTAINLDGSNYDDLRPVTKITRMYDDNGEPAYPNGTPDPDDSESESSGYYDINHYKYFYNLESLDNNGNYKTSNKKGKQLILNPVSLKDDVVINTFHKDIPTLIKTPIYKTGTIIDLQEQTDAEETSDSTTVLPNNITNLIWSYTVAPAMPYGILDWLSIDGNIDFSKIGSGEIELTEWRYYNTGNLSTLTWGLEVYPEPNKGVAEVVMDFYDNQGLACSYHITDKSSYSGTFTESISLNTRFANYKMNNIPAYPGEDGNSNESSQGAYYHAGSWLETGDPADATDDPIYVITAVDSGTKYGVNKPTKDKLSGYTYASGYFLDDSGTIYANMLYLVRITVKYCTKNVLEEFNTENTTDFRTFYRWYWTNGMFNDSYYSTKDFDVLQPGLQLDFSASFDASGASYGNNKTNTLNPEYSVLTPDLTGCDTTENSSYNYTSLGACVYHINQNNDDGENGNILLKFDLELADNYNTFYLDLDALTEGGFSEYGIATITLGHSSINYNPEQPEYKATDENRSTTNQECLQPLCIDLFNSMGVMNNEGNYIDCSGFARAAYGGNKKFWTIDALTTIGTTYSSWTNYTFNSIFSKTNDNFNKTSFDYGYGNLWETTSDDGTELAYPAYIDAFCINFATNIADKQNILNYQSNSDFSYTDGSGNTVTLDDDVYRFMPQVSELNSNDLLEGIPLALTGINLNKIYAPNIGVAGYLIVRNCLSSGLLDNIGLHEYGNHFYFNNILSTGAGSTGTGTGDPTENTGGTFHGFKYFTTQDSTFDNTAIIDYMTMQGRSNSNSQPGFTWTGGEEDNGNYRYIHRGAGASWESVSSEFNIQDIINEVLNQGGDDTTQSLFTSFVLGRFKRYDYDTGSEYSGNIWAQASGSRNGINTTNLFEFAGVTSPPSSTEVLYQRSNSSSSPSTPGPVYSTFSSGTGAYTINALLIRGTGGAFIVSDDYFVSDRYYQFLYSVTPSTSGYYCLGDMVAALFAQLYVYSSEEEKLTYFRNVAYTESYTTTWKKDIVVEIDPSLDDQGIAEEDKYTVYNSILILGQLNYDKYLQYLSKNSEEDVISAGVFNNSEINDTNLKMSLYGTNRTLEFQYQVNYSLQDLIYSYTSNSETTGIKVFPGDGSDSFVIQQDLASNQVYQLESNILVPFNGNAVFYYASSFTSSNGNYYYTPISDTMSTTGLTKFAEALSFDGKELSIGNISNLESGDAGYKLIWDDYDGGQGHYVSGIPYFSLFENNNIKLVY